MSVNQAAQAGKEAVKMVSTISLEVLKRYMNEAELRAFFFNYEKNKIRKTQNRKEIFSKEVTREEKEMLKAYLDDTEIPLKQLADQYGAKSDGKFYFDVARTALKLVFQNRHKITL